MRENCTSGSVRGAPGNGRSYRESRDTKSHDCMCMLLYGNDFIGMEL